MSAQSAKFARVAAQPASALTPPPISKKPVRSALAAPSSSPARAARAPQSRGKSPAASSAEQSAEKMTTKPQTLSTLPTEPVTARTNTPRPAPVGRGRLT